MCFILNLLKKYLKAAILELQMAINRTNLKPYPFKIDIAALNKLAGYQKARV